MIQERLRQVMESYLGIFLSPFASCRVPTSGGHHASLVYTKRRWRKRGDLSKPGTSAVGISNTDTSALKDLLLNCVVLDKAEIRCPCD